MIMYAYNLPDFSRGTNLESEVGQEYYEVEGKISDSDYAAMQKMTPKEKNQQIQLMMQSLLRERLKLKVHLESGKRLFMRWKLPREARSWCRRKKACRKDLASPIRDRSIS